MQTPYLGRVTPHMTVFDMEGKKVGTISQVYRFADTAVPAGHSGFANTPSAEHSSSVMEVKTGLFGMGQHLYIPTDAIDDGLEDSVFISKPREEFERLGWHEKPPGLDESD
ncbi:MAG TPA: hypothetical protein VHX16_13965 [Chloroflexota bacterium]|jgi:hypothetical protein|nr:hypothetical protein [Chloroflexota bacterium]